METSYTTKSGHLGGSLSLIQVLSYFLFYQSRKNNLWKIILSKGHSSLGLYSLFETIKLEKNLLNRYCLIPEGLHGHTCSKASKYILASTGSLGHGLPIAAGYSYAIKKLNKPNITLCVIGDGDLQEGSNLEIFHSLERLKHCNLKIINDDNNSVDSNFVNISNFFKNIKGNYPDLEIIKEFDMSFYESHKELNYWLNLPGLRIANCKTKKGFGFNEMYNNPQWHAGIPSENELSNFLSSADFKLIDEK